MNKQLPAGFHRLNDFSQVTVFNIAADNPDDPLCIKQDDGSYYYRGEPKPDWIQLRNGNWISCAPQMGSDRIILTASQVDAISIIESRFSQNLNPICGHPPGEGKTYIACETIKRFRDHEQYKVMVVVRSNNLQETWATSLAAFSIPFCVLHGQDRYDYLINDKYETGNATILTTYDTACIDMEKDCYIDHEFDLVIFDELHTIINPQKLTQKSILLAHLKAQHRMALTATSVQNTKEDIGLMYLFLNDPGFLTSKEAGENLIGSISKKTKKREGNPHIDVALQAVKDKNILIVPDVLQERKFTVKEIALSVPLSKEMQDFTYNNAEIQKMFKDGELLSKYEKQYLSFLTSPESLWYHSSSDKPQLSCTKMDAVDCILKTTGELEKVVIFSDHIDVLYNYEQHLISQGYKCIIIYGKDKGKELERKLAQFKNNDTFKILLTTIFKSAEGLSLESANHAVLLDFWWNPQKVIQAMGRINRLSQEKDIFVYLLCYNEQGVMIEQEQRYWDVMQKKVKEAAVFLPYQQRLPEPIPFTNEATFKEELQKFLAVFTKRREKVTEKGDDAQPFVSLPPFEQPEPSRSGKTIGQAWNAAKRPEPKDLKETQERRKKFNDIDLSGKSDETT